MVSLSRDLVFLILQFLNEEKFKDTAHRLELESGVFFNMRYFDETITNGEWEEAFKYLSGFTKVEDNQHSMRIFFEMHKQKYLEALDRYDNAKAVEILLKDLKAFSSSEAIFKELALLLTLDNFSLNWQHRQCKEPKLNPDVNTLFFDHCCGPSQPNSAHASSLVTNPLLGLPKPSGLPPLGAHGAAPPPLPPMPSIFPVWIANPAMAHPSSSAGPRGLVPPNIPAIVKRGRPRTLRANSPAVAPRTAYAEHASKKPRTSEEVNPMPINVPATVYSGQSSYSAEDLPKVVVMTLNLGSSVKSMNFHPIQQILLLVGTNAGEFFIWDLGSKERLAQKKFEVWDFGACSMPLQSTLTNDYTASVNRVTWSPDGALFGVAYSKNIVQMYSYHGGSDMRKHLEIEAHNGCVNDLAFSFPNQTLSIVTCGDDMLIKVWNAVTGDKQNQFEGHEAPVYSVCPHFKENVQFVFSSATDGKIKAWLYNDKGSRLDYTAPGHSTSIMAYSADGKRLFSCGTNKDGQSFLVEWNESEGVAKRTYSGLIKRANRPVQFDTTKTNTLLLASPCVRFNKDGMLLAVSTNDNGIKILANSDGVEVLRAMENRSVDASRVASSSAVKNSAKTPSGASANATGGSSNMDIVTTVSPITNTNSENQNLADRPGIGDKVSDKSTNGKVTEVSEPSHCRFLRLPDNTSSPMRVTRLMYTNSGLALLALAANAVHKLWKWPKSDHNSTGKATASVAPQIWQPTSGILMTNDISGTSTEDSIACFALSNNNSYVTSASGGKISLFNMMTFKTMTTFMPPPPAATFLAFHPQDNNIIAIGMNDSSIQIYNVQIDEVVKTKLKGHHKRVTSLAFSSNHNVLASSGADSQLCLWSTNKWEKQISRKLQILGGHVAAPFANTHVQFHQDQSQLLVVHETQIAIFEAPKLECLKQWGPQQANGAITHAAYSCDSEIIYVAFEDGSIDILTASTLRLSCRLSLTSYLPSNSNSKVYPLVVAAHPSKPNQFALGLTDGGVCVIEPLESEGKWGSSPGVENDAGRSSSTAENTTDQAER
ncbi:hypothetical protein E3N88_35741 [Mikania micrantha]|uniref:CTLH domain-containing protein n=1 Tax=Mikania micrantha TaxID=192012 RepID=A0A5N6M2A2_9ASTR|nr:hypothetical protein E3N88_35741 [Mikania micrantha]